MKTTFKNTIVALATVALFAPLASADYFEIGATVLGSIEGQTTSGGGFDELVNDINRANSDQNANLRTSWTDSVNSVNVAAVYDLSAVTAQVTNLDTYIVNEGNYRTTLEGENTTNDAQILLDTTNLADASNLASLAAGAYQGAQTAAASALAAFNNVVNNGGVPGEAEYDAALISRDDSAALEATLLTASNDATASETAAQDSFDASAARKVAIDGAISRSDARVNDATNAIQTINNAVATKEASLNTTNTSLTAYSEGIYDGNGNVNNLDTIIAGLDATAADPDGLDYIPDPATLPAADAGVDLTTAYLTDTLNDPQSVAAYILEADTALASITSPISQDQKDALLNTVGNGAFEREAITLIAGDVVTNDTDIAQNATDIGTTQADVDQNELDSDAADLALTNANVATQADVDQNELDSDAADLALTNANVATQADVDQNELDSDAADLALTNANVATQADVDQNELDSDAADLALTNANVATQADVDQNELDSDAADLALTNANVATQADVDQNELDSDAADLALTNANVATQADVDQNELDSDAADGALGLANAATQADVDQNELDSDAADLALTNANVATQADVDQNELDSDAADLALTNANVATQADVDQNELDSDAADLALTNANVATQADVDQNEIDSDAADLALTNANVATQADVDQNEIDSDAADGALGLANAATQADVNQNEADSDAADGALGLANAATQADVDQNEADSDAADASMQADITLLNDSVFSSALEAGEVGIAGTITKKANGDIHIGENSLITNEFTDANGVTTQSLFATDAGGNAIDINITNGSDLLINGDSVATELYADQGDADVTAAFTAADADVTAAFTAADAGLQSQINTNRADIDRNARGIAMVAALQHTTVLPGMTHALDLGAAQYEGETGLALNYSRRINENVQINFGAAATSDFDESVIKAGIGLQW